MKLRTKVILFVGTLVIFLAGLMLFFLQTSLKENFRTEITSNVRITTETLESVYYAFIKSLQVRGVEWSSDSHIRSLSQTMVDPNASVASIEKAKDDFATYVSTVKMPYDKDVIIADIINAKGIVIASTNKKRIGTDEGNEEDILHAHHFSKAIKTTKIGESFVRGVVFEEDETSEPMTHVVARIFSADKDENGNLTPLPLVLLVHFVSLKQLEDILSGTMQTQGGAVSGGTFIQKYKTSNIFFVNRDRRIVISGRPSDIATEHQKINSKSVEACLSEQKEINSQHINFRGVDVISNSVCIPRDELVLLVQVDTDEIFVFLKDFLQKAIYGGVGILILVLVASFFSIRRPFRKIYTMIDVAEKVSQGDFSKRVPAVGKDELGYLAHVFNTMLDTIQVSQKRLKEQSFVLEKDVKQHEEQEKFLIESKRATLNLLEDAWQVKEILEVEKNRLNTILSSIGDGLILIDAQYNIILANPAVVQMLGILEKELLGKDLRTVIKLWTKKTKELTMAEWPIEEMFLIKALVVAGVEDNLSLTTEKRNEQLPIALSVAPLGGGLAGAVIIFHDVTKDRELDDAKSGFISVASHQLRTPLTTIRWYAEMLLSGDAGELTASHRDFINEIHGGAERLYQTIDLLLGISRVESGKMKLEKVPIDLASFTEDIVKELKPQINMKKIIFTTIPPEVQGATVMLDPLTFRQVVLNLFSNSIRYTNDGGTIDAHWSVNETKKEVTYSVRDNGIGIPLSQRGRIFSKFFRAENALQKAPDGSGLGLALVKELVESWGGKVWFETIEGKGTTFYFTVPLG